MSLAESIIPGIPDDYTNQLLLLLHKPSINQVKLFGSRAKGNFKSGSDIDIALFGTTTNKEKMEILLTLEDLDFPWKVDIALPHQIDNEELLAHIDRVGLILLENTVS
jgi:predicted nucleotidyltransferase